MRRRISGRLFSPSEKEATTGNTSALRRLGNDACVRFVDECDFKEVSVVSAIKRL